MENTLDPDLTEYLAEYRLHEPITEHYEDGELEAQWLIAAGFPQLIKPFEEGREVKSTELGQVIANLPQHHAEVVKQRVQVLNRTVRGRTKSRYKRKPDIRDVFRDFEEHSTGTRSRSATPDSLDSTPHDDPWNNSLPLSNFTNGANAIPNEKQRQKLRRTPSAPLRGSAELFRGTNIRCDIPFYTAEGVELVGFHRIGTIHIPRVRSGSDPSCSMGRQAGNQIATFHSDNDLLMSTDVDIDTFQGSPSKISNTTNSGFKQDNISRISNASKEPISFENMCKETSQETIDWDLTKETCIDIGDINEIDYKRLQPILWLELAVIFDKHHITLDKRKPFRRKRKEEGNLFGVTLNALVRRDQQVTGEVSTLVPLFLQQLIAELKLRGSKEEGILRVPGHKQKTEHLYNELEAVFYQKPEKVPLLLSKFSVHDISALLKRWLRELPQPLLANELVHLFYQTHSIPPPDQYRALSMICILLPHENRNTIRAILLFLNYLIERQKFNKMSEHNVATIFAPSFFPPRFVQPINKNDIESQIKMAAHCCHLAKTLINQGEKLFMVPKRLIEQSKNFKSGNAKKHIRRRSSSNEATNENFITNPKHIHRLII